MGAEQALTDWKITADHKPDDSQDDTFSAFFYELLSEQRY